MKLGGSYGTTGTIGNISSIALWYSAAAPIHRQRMDAQTTMFPSSTLLFFLLMMTTTAPLVRSSIFSKPESEFFVFINAHPAPDSYTLEVFDESRTKAVGYGDYDKGALSTSGETTIKAISSLGEEIKQSGEE
jgi:hypothetical protein